ncbi:hypothetical protein DPMN_176766 [Dreissena polymorpha]|uniref:Uncharacterized protein n=1 Tax=Dreissena polymorpha TaxID=45954 RepID=A0A9D4EBM8_DREPO|nr:hypothetical protein DPMN_176766 [Dreissena polymorpha]
MYYPADNQVLSSGDYTVSSFKMDEEMEHCVPRRLVLENRPITNIVKTQNILLSYAFLKKCT